MSVIQDLFLGQDQLTGGRVGYELVEPDKSILYYAKSECNNDFIPWCQQKKKKEKEKKSYVSYCQCWLGATSMKEHAWGFVIVVLMV